MITRKNVFDHPVKNDLRTYDNTQKITNSQEVNYTAGCLLDYPYFKKHYRMIPTDLSKQRELDADPDATQQININGNLHHPGTKSFFIIIIIIIIEEAKETILDFSQGNVRVL